MTLLMLLLLTDVHVVARVHACLCLAYLSRFPQVTESFRFFFQFLTPGNSLKRSKALDSFPESLQYAECVCSLTVLSKSLFVSIS